MKALAALDPAPLVVPGGGPLADAVRALDAGGGLSPATAHRMGVLALDQAALWLAELTGRAGGISGTVSRRAADSPARVVRFLEEIAGARSEGRLPVLAPARWLERDDPLPASWEVTSDSIAAWVTGRLKARRLFLLKSFRFARAEIAADELEDAVDAFFLRALPAGVECRFLDGRQPAEVVAALNDENAGGTLLLRE